MAYENFATNYIEVDLPGRITVAANKLTVVDMDGDEECYVYKDHGAAHFSGDFEHLFEIQYSNDVNSCSIVWWMLANTVEDAYTVVFTGSNDAVVLYATTGDDYIIFRISENGSLLTDFWTPSSTATTYYITLARDDDGGANSTGQYTVEIRTGSHVGNLEDTLTLDSSAGEQNDFQYLYGVSGLNAGNAGKEIDGFTENLDLQEAAVGNPWNYYAQN